MPTRSRHDVLQGTLNLIVLKSLQGGPKHGYAITQHIERVSTELLRVEEGSLYPALHRMEQEGWISSQWGLTDTNRRARFYSLTARGQQQLAQEEQSWQRLTSGVAQVLSFAQ
jgi:transcriptional regulator